MEQLATLRKGLLEFSMFCIHLWQATVYTGPFGDSQD
jgi:hypothetical protein